MAYLAISECFCTSIRTHELTRCVIAVHFDQQGVSLQCTLTNKVCHCSMVLGKLMTAVSSRPTTLTSDELERKYGMHWLEKWRK